VIKFSEMARPVKPAWSGAVAHRSKAEHKPKHHVEKRPKKQHVSRADIIGFVQLQTSVAGAQDAKEESP
jgi:hypothetical protein